MNISENLLFRVGIASIILGLGAAIIGNAADLIDPENLFGLVIIIFINILLLVFTICGIILWVKGWHRYNKQLTNPWLLVLYLSFFTMGSYVLYYQYPSNEPSKS